MKRIEKIERIKQTLNHDYINRDNYLARFQTRKECEEEIWYIKRALKLDIRDLLHQAILEMKLEDLNKKIETFKGG